MYSFRRKVHTRQNRLRDYAAEDFGILAHNEVCVRDCVIDYKVHKVHRGKYIYFLCS